jgi:hypothetical protein
MLRSDEHKWEECGRQWGRGAPLVETQLDRSLSASMHTLPPPRSTLRRLAWNYNNYDKGKGGRLSEPKYI